MSRCGKYNYSVLLSSSARSNCQQNWPQLLHVGSHEGIHHTVQIGSWLKRMGAVWGLFYSLSLLVQIFQIILLVFGVVSVLGFIYECAYCRISITRNIQYTEYLKRGPECTSYDSSRLILYQSNSRNRLCSRPLKSIRITGICVDLRAG